MSRIFTPASIADAPEASRSLLNAVKAQLGVTPNVFLVAANSPAALESYVGMLGALAKGKLPGPTHERIALAVAEANGCDYCLSAHTYLGRQVARLDEAEMIAIAWASPTIQRPMPRCASRARSWKHAATSATPICARSATSVMTTRRSSKLCNTWRSTPGPTTSTAWRRRRSTFQS